jgi:hypothetical protein
MSDEHAIKPDVARAQEAEFFGVQAGFDYDLGDDTWTLPNPSYMPPEMKKRYLEHLRFLAEDLDSEPIVDPATGKNVRGRTRNKWPLRKDNVLIDEDELLCRALMEDAVYEKFIKAGGVPGQVQARWQMMNRQMQERLQQDSKSS